MCLWFKLAFKACYTAGLIFTTLSLPHPSCVCCLLLCIAIQIWLLHLCMATHTSVHIVSVSAFTTDDRNGSMVESQIEKMSRTLLKSSRMARLGKMCCPKHKPHLSSSANLLLYINRQNIKDSTLKNQAAYSNGIKK